MRKEIAKHVVDAVSEFFAQLDTLSDEVRQHASPSEIDRYRRATETILGIAFIEIMAPLFSEYPDLVPKSISDKLDSMKIDWTQEPGGIRSKSFVPRDKFDLERADMLESLDETALQQIAADLLVWIQDMNWPVAGRVAKALVRVGQPIVPLLLEVLQGADDAWKRSCVEYVIAKLPSEMKAQLHTELLRIANQPTRGETAEEVADVAREILEQLPRGPG